jgi:protein SCO1/2
VLPRFLPAAPPEQLAPGVMLNSPFSLVDKNGKAVTEADFAGKPTAWFYGFTHCPDVCPTTLSEMTALLNDLGPDADKVNMVFVTVDPERDTPEIMKGYIDAFDSRIVGLTGDLAQIEKMAKERFFVFGKVPLEGGGYTMNHSASTYLTRANGEFAGTLDFEEGLDVKLEKLKRLISSV